MKQPYVVILAKNTTEANQYARRAGLQRGRYRFASSASAINGLRVADVHELPTFAGRRDKHAIAAKLRWVRGERLSVEMPAALEQPAVDQGDGMGEQLTIDDALAAEPEPVSSTLETAVIGAADQSTTSPDAIAAEDSNVLEAEKQIGTVNGMPVIEDPNLGELAWLRDPTEEIRGEETGATEPSEDAAPAPKSKRRSRCAGCGELVLKSEHACDAAEPKPARPEPAPAPEPVDFDFSYDPSATPPSEYDLARMFD